MRLFGAGAVVNKEVPDFAIKFGVPARQISWINEYGERLDLSLQGVAETTCRYTGLKYVLNAEIVHSCSQMESIGFMQIKKRMVYFDPLQL